MLRGAFEKFNEVAFLLRFDHGAAQPRGMVHPFCGQLENQERLMPDNAGELAGLARNTVDEADLTDHGLPCTSLLPPG
jgi:hypothetical protein